MLKFTSTAFEIIISQQWPLRHWILLCCIALPLLALDVKADTVRGLPGWSITGDPDDEFEDEFEDDMEDEIEEEIEDGIEDEVEEGIEDEVEEGIEDEVEEGIEDEVEEGIEDEVEEGLEDEVEEGLEDEVEEGLEDEMEEGLEDEMEEGLEDEMEEGLEDEMEEGLEDEMEEGLEDEMEEGFEDGMDEGLEDEIEFGFEDAADDIIEMPFDESVELEIPNEPQWGFEDAGFEFEQDLDEVFEEEFEDEFLFDVIEEDELAEDFTEEFYDEIDDEFDWDEGTEEVAFDGELEQVVEQALEQVEGDYQIAKNNLEQQVWTEQWLIFSTPEIQKELEAKGYRFVAKKHLSAFDKTLSTVVAPASFSLRKDYQLVLNQLNSSTLYADLNHVYRHHSAPRPPSGNGKIPAQLLSLPMTSQGIEIGMIDTAINTEHDAFKHALIEQRSFVAQKKQEPRAHGTQIAGILVGQNEQYQGLLPKAKLLGASVFFRQKNKGNIATTESLLMALNWLAEKQVNVINMSLSGPPNKLLEFAVNELCRKNIVIVAAVGNTGPLSKPLYPAGYDCAVAVTAVDDKNRIYKNAVIGPHVDMAAFGVDVKTLTAKKGYRDASGTSLATAFVSAYIAAKEQLLTGQKSPLQTRLSKVYQTCQDLGVKGRDPVFGHGLLPKS